MCILAVAGFLTATAAPAQDDQRLDALERAINGNPEDLGLCAGYRQRIIASGQYDRATTLLERLSSRPGAGPNVFLSLALAYVDKIPAASSFRRTFLGFDAVRAVSRSIDRRPTMLAYYVRGLVNLYYPESLFHRARGSVADLERAREMLPTSNVRTEYHVRVYMSLGDAYWRINDLEKARAEWTEGAERFPGNDALRARLSLQGRALARLIDDALDPAVRVDTSLRELF